MFRIYPKEVAPAECEAISRIQEWTNRCIEERDGLVASSPSLAPSTMWEYSSLVSSHMRRMPPEDFGTLRLHTYHIDNTRSVGNELGFPQELYQQPYEDLRADLPERYWIGAPQACGEWGHLIDGRLVSNKILTWQRTFRNLWHSGELTRLEKSQSPIILEIGGGYGGIAHHLMTMFPKARYIIVDIPETMVFSASYLTLIHGPDRVQLLERETKITTDSWDAGSFLMVPNYLLSSLSSLHFDMAVNMWSFGEMTENQVTEYLEFLAPRTDVLYSKNQNSNVNQYRTTDSHGYFALTPLLRKFFDLKVLTHWPVGVSGKMGGKSPQQDSSSSAFPRKRSGAASRRGRLPSDA